MLSHPPQEPSCVQHAPDHRGCHLDVVGGGKPWDFFQLKHVFKFALRFTKCIQLNQFEKPLRGTLKQINLLESPSHGAVVREAVDVPSLGISMEMGLQREERHCSAGGSAAARGLCSSPRPGYA